MENAGIGRNTSSQEPQGVDREPPVPPVRRKRTVNNGRVKSAIVNNFTLSDHSTESLTTLALIHSAPSLLYPVENGGVAEDEVIDIEPPDEFRDPNQDIDDLYSHGSSNASGEFRDANQTVSYQDSHVSSNASNSDQSIELIVDNDTRPEDNEGSDEFINSYESPAHVNSMLDIENLFDSIGNLEFPFEKEAKAVDSAKNAKDNSEPHSQSEDGKIIFVGKDPPRRQTSIIIEGVTNDAFDIDEILNSSLESIETIKDASVTKQVSNGAVVKSAPSKLNHTTLDANGNIILDKHADQNGFNDMILRRKHSSETLSDLEADGVIGNRESYLPQTLTGSVQRLTDNLNDESFFKRTSLPNFAAHSAALAMSNEGSPLRRYERSKSLSESQTSTLPSRYSKTKRFSDSRVKPKKSPIGDLSSGDNWVIPKSKSNHKVGRMTGSVSAGPTRISSAGSVASTRRQSIASVQSQVNLERKFTKYMLIAVGVIILLAIIIIPPIWIFGEQGAEPEIPLNATITTPEQE